MSKQPFQNLPEEEEQGRIEALEYKSFQIDSLFDEGSFSVGVMLAELGAAIINHVTKEPYKDWIGYEKRHEDLMVFYYRLIRLYEEYEEELR